MFVNLCQNLTNIVEGFQKLENIYISKPCPGEKNYLKKGGFWGTSVVAPEKKENLV